MAVIALALAVVVALLLASAGLGYRFGLWGLGPAFGILKYSMWGAAVVLIVSIVALVIAARGGSGTAVAGGVLALLIAVGTAAVPLDMRRTAQSVPFIHDITTDPDQPPAFVALKALRERAPNGAAYGGPEVAAQQRQGYPDIAPLRLALPPAQAFARAEAAARSLGWEIAAAVPAGGRIEATATTRWFGFKDDVVIRVTPDGDGSRVDIRSVSRVGRSDLGANAHRIRAFLAALRSPASA